MRLWQLLYARIEQRLACKGTHMSNPPGYFLECRFHPFTRNHYYIAGVTPEGPTDFRVPWPEDRPIPGEGTEELAALKSRPECPEWAKKWKDEYYIEILNRTHAG